MEIVGGFMVMMSIIGFFLAVIWLIMPFVVLAVKGKQDRTLDVLDGMVKQLKELDERLARLEQRQKDGLEKSAPVVTGGTVMAAPESLQNVQEG